MKTTFLKLLIVALAVVTLGPLPSPAGTLNVSPVIVEMTGGTQASTLNISNPDATPAVVQVRIFAWDQENGTDRYQPTTEVMASPPIFTLPAGETQVVRVVAPGPFPSEERSYRLVIDQVPDLSAKAQTIRVPIRIDLPVFLTPNISMSSRLEWRAEQSGSELIIAATNTGKRWERLSDLSVTNGGGREIAQLPRLSGYVLAGSTRTWRFPASASGSVLRVNANGDRGPVSAEAQIGGQ